MCLVFYHVEREGDDVGFGLDSALLKTLFIIRFFL